MIIIQIAGHLGVDPETRFTPSGQKVTTLRVATNTRKAGKDETVWWRVTVWGDRFDKMMAYLKKGSAVVVVGEMSKPDIFTDKEGRTQVSLELTAEIIRFSPFGKPEQSNKGPSQEQANPGHNPYPMGSGYQEQGFSQPAPRNANYPTGGYAQPAPHATGNQTEDDLPF